VTSAPPPQEVWDQDLAAIQEPPADWLWHGLLARGNLTLLTSVWKSGKTTLLSLLLSRRKQGGHLAGLAVQPGKTAVITEEHPRLWADRARRYDFGGQVCFFPQPFRTLPTPDQWQALIDRVRALHHQHGLDLVVIDPLAPFLRGENQARTVLEALLPLGDLTRLGMAGLVLHHPSKADGRLGYSSRGSGALLGHVDVSVEMRHPGGDPLTRRRRFLALSRHAETPRQLLLELNAEATDYVPVADTHEDTFQANWDVLRTVLEDAPQKLTRLDVLDQWPPTSTSPTPPPLPRGSTAPSNAPWSPAKAPAASPTRSASGCPSARPSGNKTPSTKPLSPSAASSTSPSCPCGRPGAGWRRKPLTRQAPTTSDSPNRGGPRPPKPAKGPAAMTTPDVAYWIAN
jgi:hypothetical protein